MQYRKLPIALVAFAALLACANDEAATRTSSGKVAGAIGVAECDDYLSKYDACVARVPASSRSTLAAGAAQMRASWRQAALNPAARSGLGQGCRRALEAAKHTMASYGCSW